MSESGSAYSVAPHRHQSWVEIDLPAARRNFERVAEHFPSAGGIILSAKKDAYGHGVVEVARALAGMDRLSAIGVATMAEAAALRRADVRTPILCFSVLRGEDLREAIEQDIILTVTMPEDAGQADEAARALGRAAVGHLKIDTGMGRLGLPPRELVHRIQTLTQHADFTITSIYTHLADAWGDPNSARNQISRLGDFLSRLEKHGLPRYSVHLGGSDAASIAGELDRDEIRSGIAVYGYHPGIPDLEPVMTFKSRVIYRRTAPAGMKVSYGGTHTLQRDSELALVGAGYGNGYPRALSNRGQVLLRGVRCAVLGRVCMDQIIVDVTDIPEVSVGDEAVLFGRQGSAILGADEVAARAGTIPYELLCLAGQINPRFHLDQQ